MGRGEEAGLAPARGAGVAFAVVYLSIVVALAAFGAGRLREFLPRFAIYHIAGPQPGFGFATSHSVVPRHLAMEDAHPRTDPARPHLIPGYPILAMRRHEEGDVLLKVLVRPDGEVGDDAVIKSSGHPQLDAAALTGVGGWHYLPAVRDHRPVAAWTKVLIRFRTGGE